MPETSREFIVMLPDDHQFTVPVQPSLQAIDLLDMAASHCKIKEKGYFGLYLEEDGYRNWLELDKPVLDASQEIPKGNDAVRIFLSFKYYTDTYQDFQDSITVELLYLQCCKAMERGDIVTDEETVFELTALVMQVTNGPFTTEEEAKKVLQALRVPAYVFDQTRVKDGETQILRYYKMFEKYGRGESIFRYLEIVQSLPMYSYHYFEVKDKNNAPLWLGVGPAGIIQCPHDNRSYHSNHYQWVDLQNIYYKDKKFMIEVYANKSPKKTSTFQSSSSSVTMQSWYGKNSKVVMAIWRMVRDQHIFYRNKRTSKVSDFSGENEEQKPGMSTAEILRHLNHKHQHGSISPSSSHSSLSIESAKSNQMTATAEAMAAAKKAQQEMYMALLTKREVLMEDFESKLTQYKGLLLKEMQITGVPPEGLTAEEIEKMRTKFSINFKFSKFLLDKNNAMGTEVDELEKQLEVQSAILEAQKSLVEQAKTRNIKKDRKKDVKRAEEKFMILEEKLCELKTRHQRRPYSEAKYDSPTFSLPPPNATLPSPASSRHSARHSSPNSSMLIDDTVISRMIFDDSNHHISPLISSPKSPMHKNAATLHDFSEIPRSYTLNHAHKHLSGTQSLAHSSSHFHESSQLNDSNRSFSTTSNLSTSVESNKDSFLREYPRSQYGSVGSVPRSQDEYRQVYTPVKTSNLTGATYKSNDHQTSQVQTHATMMYPPTHRNSSPEVLTSTSGRTRNSNGTFSPDLYSGYQNPNIVRSRPHSTHSRGTTPPYNSTPNDRSSRGISYNKEMNLQEALMMDQDLDEGTLV